MGTLLASANVVAPSDPQNYGAIAPGGMAARDFSFTVNGSCGQTITLMLQLQDGATNLGTVTYTLTLGQIENTAPPYTENFDGVTAPALPVGWTTAFVLPGGKPWTTTTSFSDTAPNSAATIADVQSNLTTCVGGQGGADLTSPIIAIPNPPSVGVNGSVQLRFRNFYNLEQASTVVCWKSASMAGRSRTSSQPVAVSSAVVITTPWASIQVILYPGEPPGQVLRAGSLPRS
ncbi:MAG: hypothetical protein ABR568_13050 [Pyrinomonadaceae bacterium]